MIKAVRIGIDALNAFARRGVIFWVGLFALAGVSACGPIYETVYDYKPPATAEGQRCVSQCSQITSLCTRNCDLEEDRCLADAREDAIYDYERYVKRREAEKLPIEKSVSDFEYTGSCYTARSCKSTCDDEYRRCFMGCGGEVSSRQICTAFCN